MMRFTIDQVRRRLGRGQLECPLSGRTYRGGAQRPPVVTQLNPHALRQVRGGQPRGAQL